MNGIPMTPPETDIHWVKASIAGLAACLVGIGVARFAYSPLLPMVIAAGWFDAGDAAYLGAANLAGYLAGALSARWVGTKMPVKTAVPLMMLICGLSFATCAVPAPFAWFFVWRFAGGVAGGVIMILSASAVLGRVPPARRGLAGGIAFTGVGVGIALGGIIVPLLASFDLGVTWAALAAACGLVLLLSWPLWRQMDEPSPNDNTTAKLIQPDDRSLYVLYAIYTLAAIGLVSPMVFLADYVARSLNMGVAGAGIVWVTFGVGALFGAIGTGRLADAIGFRNAIVLAVLIEIATVAAIPFTGNGPFLYVAALITGALVPGIVPLAAGRSHILAGNDPARRRRAWSRATTGFSVGQAAAGYLLSFIYDVTGRHDLLFFISAAVAVIALALVLVPSLNPEPKDERL